MLRQKRHGSFRNDDLRRSGSGRGSSSRKFDGSGRRQFPVNRRRLHVETPGNLKLYGDDFQEILDNPKLADFNEGPSHMIVIDIECLAMLNKLPDALDHLKSELKHEMQSIVSRSTQNLIDNGAYPQGDIKLLQELFTMIVDQITLVVDAYKILAESVQKSVARNKCDPVRFDIAEVWAKAQSVMQLMLTDYLDFKRSKSAAMQQQQNSAASTTYNNSAIADINSCFVRRKGQKPKREQLFKFDYSSTALSMNDYLKEQNAEGSKEKVLVCQPNPHNITPIYTALMDFVGVVESALKCDPG